MPLSIQTSERPRLVFLRQRLSLNPKLTNWVRMTDHGAPGTLVSAPPHTPVLGLQSIFLWVLGSSCLYSKYFIYQLISLSPLGYFLSVSMVSIICRDLPTSSTSSCSHSLHDASCPPLPTSQCHSCRGHLAVDWPMEEVLHPQGPV